MADAAEAWAGRWFRRQSHQGSLLILAGASGAGKTHTAEALHRWCSDAAMLAWEKGHWPFGNGIPKTLLLRWPEACTHFENERMWPLEDSLNAALLVLDDVGAENDPWKKHADKLCQILTRREFRFTIITTNIAPEGWAKHFDNRIADRLMRNSVILDLTNEQSYSLR